MGSVVVGLVCSVGLKVYRAFEVLPFCLISLGMSVGFRQLNLKLKGNCFGANLRVFCLRH